MPFDVDAALDEAGGFGRFQIVATIVLSSTHILGAFHAMLWVFVGMEPTFKGHDKCPFPDVPQSHVGETAVADWGLMCGREYEATVISSSFFFGFLLGTISLGSLCDHMGRKAAVMAALVLTQVSAMVCALASTPEVFCVGRVIGGLGLGGLGLSSFVWNAELVGPKRSLLSVIASTFFTIGVCGLSAMAWAVPLWRSQCWGTFCVGLPIFVGAGLLPESPKWLETAQQAEAARAAVLDIAAFNGVPPPIFREQKEGSRSASSGKTLTSIGVLLRTPLGLRTVVMSMAWFAASLAYYGLALNSGSLGSDIYMTSALGALAEVPAYLVVGVLVDHPAVGRRGLASTCFIAAGLACCYGSRLPSSGHELIIAAMAGRFSIAAAFAVIYLWGAELYPTTVRAMALGVQSMMARVAGIIAPFVLLYADPQLLFLGVPAVVAGLICMGLPETLGQPLPDSVEDMLKNNERTRLAPRREEREPGSSDVGYGVAKR